MQWRSNKERDTGQHLQILLYQIPLIWTSLPCYWESGSNATTALLSPYSQIVSVSEGKNQKILWCWDEGPCLCQSNIIHIYTSMSICSQIEVGDQRFSGSFGNRHRYIIYMATKQYSRRCYRQWNGNSFYYQITIIFIFHWANRQKRSVLILQSPHSWGD